jgi:hypothetical protein
LKADRLPRLIETIDRYTNGFSESVTEQNRARIGARLEASPSKILLVDDSDLAAVHMPVAKWLP